MEDECIYLREQSLQEIFEEHVATSLSHSHVLVPQHFKGNPYLWLLRKYGA